MVYIDLAAPKPCRGGKYKHLATHRVKTDCCEQTLVRLSSKIRQRKKFFKRTDRRTALASTGPGTDGNGWSKDTVVNGFDTRTQLDLMGWREGVRALTGGAKY